MLKFHFFCIKFLFVLVVVFCGCRVGTKKLPGDFIVRYPYANDSFLVRVTDLTTNVQAKDTIHFVYYVDESLKSGKQMEQMIEKYKQDLIQKKYAFVGIAHFGYFRSKRRRDFISPSVKTENGFVGRSDTYGQADFFYQVLKNKIIPKAEGKFSGHPAERSFIGHSLGGLFATYLLINDDSLFQNLYALSPSLWVDDYHILEYENLQKNKLMNVRKDIWISCGSEETLNKIRSSVKKIEDILKTRKYPGVKYFIKVYSGETHNSSVQPALNEIFEGF